MTSPGAPARRCDVLIVGAGPAGTGAALALLRQRPDLEVLLVDRAPPGRDKICGDAVGPEALRWLTAVGQQRLLHAGEGVGRFRVVAPRGVTVADSTTVRGFVVPRAEFDARLLAGARSAGAGFRQGRLVGLHQDDSGVTAAFDDGTVVRAGHVVGADGANSVVRRELGIASNSGRHMAVAVRGYAGRLPGDRELLLVWDRTVAPLGYAWAFPLADARTNVGYGVASDVPPAGRAWLVERCRSLLGAAAPQLSTSQVAFAGHRLPLSSERPAPAHGRVLLAGDAASLVNPLSGEGICFALGSGVLAGRAIADAGPGTAATRYTAALRLRFGHQMRQFRLAYRLMGPRAVDAAVAVAARDERVLSDLLGFILGTGTLSSGEVARITARWLLAGTGPGGPVRRDFRRVPDRPPRFDGEGS